MAALFRISETHPHKKFAKFLRIYTSMFSTDREVLNRHIMETANQSYVDLTHQITSKKATVGPLFMMMSSAAFAAPIFLIILLKFPSVPAELLLLSINFMPIVMLAVVVMVVSLKVFAGDILQINRDGITIGDTCRNHIICDNHGCLCGNRSRSGSIRTGKLFLS